MRFSPLALVGLIALPAAAEPPKIVTDIAPVHSIVAQVMSGVAVPDLLLEGAADPHSVQLRPSQARMLQNADLVVWIGPELEPWLERALEGVGQDKNLVLLDAPETHLRDFADHDDDDHDRDHDGEEDHAHEDGHDHDGEEDHAHEDGHDHDGEEDHAHEDSHDHDHDGTDPHAWLAPENASAWLTVLARELSTLDPENAATYAANAEAAKADLARLDDDIAARLAPFEGQEIITFHDAFGYFTDAYGIEVLGHVRPGDASAPSAAAISELRALVAEHGVSCAFGEPAYDPALLTALADETGLRIGVLDATGGAMEAGPALYANLIEGLADEMIGCFEG